MKFNKNGFGWEKEVTKKYVDDKTEILPVKNSYIVFEDAIPSLMDSEVNTYGLVETKDYIFDSLQNENMIISVIKFNLNVTLIMVLMILLKI